MATDIERLIVSLEAKTATFEKALNRANGVANQKARQIETRFIDMNAKVAGAFANFGKGLLAGAFAGGVTGIVTQLGQVAKSIATIGDEAKRAGVSAKAFQEWKFVAEQNRIGIDSMVDGLKELNLRADEFVQTGSGPAAEAFQRLGYGAADLQKKLKNPSALMLEIIKRLGQMDQAAQIRIADELFGGTGGERFVELLQQGEKGIRATIDRAHELGVIMDNEVIAKAAELDRQFNAVATTVSTGLKKAIVESAAALQDFIDAFQGMWAQYEERKRAAELGALAGSLVGTPMPPDPINRTTPKTDRLPEAVWTPPTPPPGGFGSIKHGSSAPKRDRAAEAAEREAEAVRRLIGELEDELRLVGATDLERETANALRQAGAAATDQQRTKIVALVAALHAEEEAVRKASDATEELREVGRDVLGGIVGDLRAGKDAADILAGALDRVADRLADMALDTPFGGVIVDFGRN